MAEYKMSYDELQRFVEEAIQKSHGDKDKLLSYKAEILTALTGTFSEETMANQREQEQLLELWSNQQGSKSQLLLGKRHIRIHDGMLAFLEELIVGGAMESVLSMVKGMSFAEAITISTASSVIFALVHLFRKAATLDDFDFCLYMQAVTHFYEKKEFTKDDINSWYPLGGSCNMHNSKWDCSHLEQNDCCGATSDLIDDAIESLVCKDILELDIRNGRKLYKIKG